MAQRVPDAEPHRAESVAVLQAVADERRILGMGRREEGQPFTASDAKPQLRIWDADLTD